MTRIRPTAYPAQLLYPLASTNDYFMPTNGVFANYYNAKINVCGQCHNDAGASWTNTAAPPHASPQYNMLLGNDWRTGPRRGRITSRPPMPSCWPTSAWIATCKR